MMMSRIVTRRHGGASSICRPLWLISVLPVTALADSTRLTLVSRASGNCLQVDELAAPLEGLLVKKGLPMTTTIRWHPSAAGKIAETLLFRMDGRQCLQVKVLGEAKPGKAALARRKPPALLIV